MPHRYPLTRLLAILLLLYTASTGAQGPWYMVELVVFSTTDPGPANADDGAHALPQMPDTSLAVPLERGSNEVQALGPGSYRLAGVWQELRASGRYRPIRHMAWRQVATSLAQAPLVQIGEGPGANVFGTVRLSRSQYLHLELDLLVRDDQGSYRIQTRRKITLNKLVYIDNPLFGVLARIARE